MSRDDQDPDRISTLPPPADLPRSDTVSDTLSTYAEVVRLLTAIRDDSAEERRAFYRWAEERSRKDDLNWETMKRSLRRIDERLDEGDSRFSRIEEWMREKDRHDRYVLDRISALALQPHSLQQGLPLNGHTVVILEDGDDLRGMMCRICLEAGAKAFGARDADQARALVDLADCVTIDLLLGDGEDGMAFARSLRAAKPQCGALLVTGRVSDAQLKEAEVFALPILEKPFTPNQLVSAILSARAGSFSQASPGDPR